MKETVRRRAIELGFDACRITGPQPPASAGRFLEALDAGRHAGMSWMARNAERRVDPDRVLPGLRSVVALAVSYHGPEPVDVPSGAGIVARYARHADYHDVLTSPLRTLAAEIDHLGGPGTRSLWYVDTGPLLERDLAQRAGIGFVGKHTNLISRNLGNWFLLAEVLTTLELEPDEPERNRCGSCSRCLDACPTGALPAPFTLDARRCISYLTIELKDSIPESLRPLIGDRIYGCDDCLAACPWNRFAREGALMREHRRADLFRPSLADLLSLDDAGFKRMFAGTPMLRTKRRGLLRNACVALGNTGTLADLPVLERAASDPEPLVAEHAAWAIREVRRRSGGPASAA
jgi:epoxyqueuosine reductase